ncbi:MAG: hypothetical protein ACRD1Z_10665, partial [Vicinamibacteria bacterium]
MVPRVALVLGAAPAGLRRMLLESIAQPYASEGRRVLLLESDPHADDGIEILQEVYGLDLPIMRRSLGASPRDVLLLPAAERRSLFARLAADEGRSDLVLIDLGLPESILCPRLQFLVDTLVVALTSDESSLYEAYRALRGLSERRPGLGPFVVSLAQSAEEGELLFDRFRQISKDFLNVPVVDGGWLELREGSSRDTAPAPFSASLSDELVEVLASVPPRGLSQDTFLGNRDRPFFDHLCEWLDPFLQS